MYDHTSLLEILTAEVAARDITDGEEYEDEELLDDAEEWIDYNMAGVYLGPDAPGDSEDEGEKVKLVRLNKFIELIPIPRADNYYRPLSPPPVPRLRVRRMQRLLWGYAGTNFLD